MCSVFLSSKDKVITIDGHHLEPVVPSTNELVKVIHGKFRESIGTMVSIDGQEGVVKFDGAAIEMCELRHLCKMTSKPS